MSAVTEGLRTVLAELADEMIPAGAGLPSANEVGISADLLDQVLRTRPDLDEPLAAALASVAAVRPGNRLAALQRDPQAIDVVGLVIAGGYLMSPTVAGLLRYPWQEAKQVRPDDVYQAVDDGLLDAVIERGPIYRLPPDAPGGPG